MPRPQPIIVPGGGLTGIGQSALGIKKTNGRLVDFLRKKFKKKKKKQTGGLMDSINVPE